MCDSRTCCFEETSEPSLVQSRPGPDYKTTRLTLNLFRFKEAQTLVWMVGGSILQRMELNGCAANILVPYTKGEPSQILDKPFELNQF